MKKQKFLSYFLIIIFLILTSIPIVFIVCGSFMSKNELLLNFQRTATTDFIRLNIIPDRFSLMGYVEILFKSPAYLNSFWNSVFYTFTIIFGSIIVSFSGAYALYRMDNRFSDILLGIYAIVMLMPYQAVCVPNAIVVSKLGLMDSYFSIILPAIFNPVGVFFLRQYMRTIPKVYFESGKIDGMSEFMMCLKIALPLSKAGISSLAIILCIDYWNIIEQPLIFIQSPNKEPLSVFLTTISNTSPAYIFSASVFFMIIPLLFFLDSEDSLISGIQLTGLK